MKQSSWFKTEVDFESSFKFWFALMWQNSYIQLFSVGFILLLMELIKFGWVLDTVSENFSYGVFGGIFTLLGMVIPLAVTSVIGYKGFYQFWKDIKFGKTR